jgi:hypothetical protein
MTKRRRKPKDYMAREMQRLLVARLTKQANEYHEKVRCAWRGALEYAKKCGETLNKIRWETDNWKKIGWKQWIRENFHGSYETANIYIRIHKKWDDPRLVEARKAGLKLESIESVLNILRTKVIKDAEEYKSEPYNPEDDIKFEKWWLRDNIRWWFKSALQNLCVEELRVFQEEFEELWAKFYKIIYERTCIALEADLNEMLLETGRLDKKMATRSTMYKSRKQQVTEAEKAAAEDLKVPSKTLRKKFAEELRKRQWQISRRVRLALNKRKRAS